MEDIETMAMKIVHAYEDLFFDQGKRAPFDSILRRYLGLVDPDGEMDLYEAAVALGRNHGREFQEMVQALREKGLLPD